MNSPNPDQPGLSGDRVSGGRERLSKKERLRIAEYLDLLFRHRCVRCGKECRIRYLTKGCLLEQDHLDGRKENNSLSNFRWLCKTCNLAMRYQGTGRSRLDEKERADGELVGESSEEVRTSIEYRPRFQAWLAEKILRAEGPVTSKYAVRSGAQHIRNLTGGKRGSKVTTQRWLEELTSDEGPFELYELKDWGQCVRFRWNESLEGKPPPWEIQVTRAEGG